MYRSMSMNRATRFMQSQRGTFKREFGPIWKNEDIFLKLNDLPRHLVKMSQNSPINYSFVLSHIFILNPSNL